MSNKNLWDTGLALCVAGVALLVGGIYGAIAAIIIGGAMMTVGRLRKDELGEPFENIRLVSRAVSTTPSKLVATQSHAENKIVVHSFELRGTRFSNDPADMVRWYSLHLFLKNDSDVPAKQVGATIKFSRVENGEIKQIKELDHGRWADGHYPSAEHPKSEINVADFAPRQIRDLDIAMEVPEDVDCYAVNNDNFIGVPELRIDMHRLSGTNLLADVEINGSGVSRKAWQLKFNNPGKGSKLEDLNYTVTS
jgi:hypothetical protein